MLDFHADFPRGALVADAQAQHAPQGIQQIRHLPVVVDLGHHAEILKGIVDKVRMNLRGQHVIGCPLGQHGLLLVEAGQLGDAHQHIVDGRR